MSGLQINGYSLDFLLLTGSLLLVISVLASKVSSKVGVPALLMFLGIGILSGVEGPGGIYFNNYPLSAAVGSVCLAIIMFDGGFRTLWQSVRPVLALGVSLSFIGTVVTGIISGIFAKYALGLAWLEAMILGSIVSSTDAAAVFSILRARRLSLKGTLKQALEFEAASNDPVAVFLTIGFLSIAIGTMGSEGNIVGQFTLFFIAQAGLGFFFGWLGARIIRRLTNTVDIEYEGLYGVLLLGLGVCLFATTSSAGGSGFLAVYMAGIILGNSELLHKGSITRFLDGIAWLSQILVFLTLGLLVTPSHLIEIWKDGLILSVFLMVVARPLSVLIASLPFQLSMQERIFISWVGLRGVAPIILATLPWSVGLGKAEYFFNLVFFVVFSSVIAQGISIPFVARKLGVTEQLQEGHVREFAGGMLPVGFILVEILVGEDSEADQRRIVELPIPSGVLLTSIERGNRYVIPRGDTFLYAGDRIFGLARPSNIGELGRIFGEAREIV